MDLAIPLDAEHSIPHLVGIRVECGMQLGFFHIGEKQKKTNTKWKCKIYGSNKTIYSDTCNDPNGSPVWNFVATFKLSEMAKFVYIVVCDSNDNHVGGVEIPFSKMANGENGFDITEHKPQICALQKTKKTNAAQGMIKFWIWVQQYMVEGPKLYKKSASMLSINESGGSQSNGHSYKPSRKKPSFLHKKISRNASRNGSMLSLNKSNDFDAYNDDDHSVLKSGSDLTQSEIFYATSYSQPPPSENYTRNSVNQGRLHSKNSQEGSVLSRTSSFQRVNSIRGQKTDRVSGGSGSGSVKSSVVEDQSRITKSQDLAGLEIRNPFDIDCVDAEEIAHVNKETESMHMPTMTPRENPFATPPIEKPTDEHTIFPLATKTAPTKSGDAQPRISFMDPCRGSSQGGEVVRIHGQGFSESVMKRAMVLVDGFPIASSDWCILDENTLQITMPSMDPGEYTVSIDTMKFGYIECPTPYCYEKKALVSKSGVQIVYAPEDKVQETSTPPVEIVKPITVAAKKEHMVVVSQPNVFTSSSDDEEKSSPDNCAQGHSICDSGVMIVDSRKVSEFSETDELQQQLPESSDVEDKEEEEEEEDGRVSRRRSSLSSSHRGRSKLSSTFSNTNTPNNHNDVHMKELQENKKTIVDLSAEIERLEEALTQVKCENVHHQVTIDRQQSDIDRLSAQLCALRSQLLEDGQLKYLEV